MHADAAEREQSEREYQTALDHDKQGEGNRGRRDDQPRVQI
jgi:hypothetical protein